MAVSHIDVVAALKRFSVKKMYGYFTVTKKFCRNNEVTVGQSSTAVKVVFTFDALALVPEHWHKIVLLSNTGYSKSCSTSTVPKFWCEYME